METQDLTSAQWGAIKRGIELGRTLINERPEIADLYGKVILHIQSWKS